MKPKTKNRSSASPVISILFALVAVILLPVQSVLAYEQTYRDEPGPGVNFYGSNPGWVYQNNQYNGYDWNTELDCLENLPNCESGPNGDYGKYWPTPSPQPYWMCPYAHIASESNWSSADAKYYVDSGGGSQTSTLLDQPYYLNAWVTLPNANFWSDGFVEVANEGGGNGTISADMITFHYNSLNAGDSTCH